MATQAYRDWNRNGRPYSVATPVARLYDLARAHGVPLLGTLGNQAHLESNNPQDHTPFSVTAWPRPLPGYIVTACDLGDGPWTDRILADARSGRAPWVKYINARNKQWNVKNGWNPVYSSDSHLHVSARTDFLTWWDTSWNPFVATSPAQKGNKMFLIEWNNNGTTYWISDGVQYRTIRTWDNWLFFKDVRGLSVVTVNGDKAAFEDKAGFPK